MNFDQSFPDSAAAVPYQVSLEVEELIQQLSDYYERYAREEAADARYHEGGEFSVLDRWQELGYPPLADLIAQEPEVLEKLIKDWFNQDVLDRIVPGPEAGLPRFLVNTIDRVMIDNGHIRIEGEAYLHPALRQRVP
jgi:hypothetical protein